MVLFWIAAAALSLAAVVLIVAGAREASRVTPEADPTLDLYRRQMREIDELVERGVLDEKERRAARAEAGRRLLAAADGAKPGATPAGPSRGPMIAMVLMAPLAALLVYLAIGSPGAADQPFKARVSQWRNTNPSSLDPPRLVAVLKEVLATRPNDVEGLRFLADAQIGADDPFNAAATARRALALAPDRADLWAVLGTALMDQSEGKVQADAEAAFAEALKRDPASPRALYYLGQSRIEAGQTAEGVALWRRLEEALPPDNPGRAQLAGEIAEVERTGRLPGPAGGQAQDGQQMQAAIRGMVEGLAARLAQNPDDPDGWVRLVRAYTVLGETAKRDAALDTARGRYRDRPDVLGRLQQASEAP